jgi:hypothetical protein
VSELLWIAVPGGITSGTALLRVLVVPKLDGGPLSRHGMEHWPPTTLQQGPVRVEVHAAGASSQAQPALTRDVTPTIAFQRGLWELLMDRITVESIQTLRAAPTDQLNVHETSRDARAIARVLQATSGVRVTPEMGGQSPDYVQAVRDALRRYQAEVVAAVVSEQSALPAPPTPVPAGFHRTLSLLREHPTILRALGLILELRLNASELTSHAGGTVRVNWPGRAAPLPPVVSPRTRFGAEFLPGAAPNLNAGMVTLDRLDSSGARRWDVVTVDVDVATQRLREAARAVTDRSAEPVTLPALRSSGLQLLLRGRGDEMQHRLAQATDRQRRSALPDVLTAEDLLLGYRIDVLPNIDGARWRSLQQRKATYRILRRTAGAAVGDDSAVVGTPNMLEEGHVKTNAAILDADGLHTDEIVAAWRGYSIAVPRPSFAEPTRMAAPAQPAMNVTMTFEATAGSLPRLRFKGQYTLRARVADIAGGGLELADPTPDAYRTLPISYGRYEPMLPPGVAVLTGVDPTKLGPGEAIEQVVIRSDPTAALDIARYAARFGYRRDDQRRLLPPTATQQIAEQHGMFDGVASQQSWDWVSRALEGALSDPAAAGITVAGVTPGAPDISQLAWDGQWPDLQPRTLHLREPATGRPPVAWEGGWLIVRLAPAEQLTLQLSSFPREGLFEDFAVHNAIPAGDSLRAAKQGRHPMLSPVRTVTFIHAVQRPLAVPGATLTAVREFDQSFASLNPGAPVFDPKSTGQLDVTATWTDQDDHTTKQVVDAPVASFTIRPDDSPQPATLFRHEFGDTRHRTVTYTLRAVSRFRQYFNETDPKFYTRTTSLTVPILSSSRPPPPAVLAARPAFEWKETGNLNATDAVFTRRRLATRIRITLQPPWHTSGAGELLGVVVRPDGSGSELDGVVSQAGYDPIYPSFGVAGDGPYAREITSGTGQPQTLWIEEARANAVVVTHQPHYLADEQCWVSDVSLTGPYERSLVQLVVARYQPDSMDRRWLSDLVRADTVPILPERTLTVTRKEGAFEVKLVGVVSMATSVNRVDMVLERCRRPAGLPAEAVDLIGFGAQADGVPAWIKDFSLRVGPKAPWADNRFRKRWEATFQVRPGEVYRVRVREVEFIPNKTDHQSTELQTGTPGEVNERLVFTDIVQLPVL